MDENLEIDPLESITKDPELVNYIKTEIKEKANDIDDLELTRILIQEINNRTFTNIISKYCSRFIKRN